MNLRDAYQKEMEFREWYRGWADKLNLNPNPYHPKHYYDFKSAWEAGVEPKWQPEHNQYRWDDRWKLEGHPNMDNRE